MNANQKLISSLDAAQKQFLLPCCAGVTEGEFTLRVLTVVSREVWLFGFQVSSVLHTSQAQPSIASKLPSQ